MWICLGAGCTSPSTENRKVYDRYAEMVAARNRAQPSPAGESAAPVMTSRPAVKPPDAQDRRPVNFAPPAKPAPGAPATPAPPVAKPVPVPAPPVQVIAPKPVEKVAVQPVEAQVQSPTVPVAPVVAKPSPAPAPAPVPVAESSLPTTTSPAGDGVAYALKVGDGVQIYLRGIPMSDVIEDIIDENGKISLPLVNEIQAAGMTASDLERNIRKTYLDLDIYRNITVNVVVPTRYYFIQGEIRQPGRFQIMSATRVSQAIAAAGGYTEYANGQVVVKRGGKIFKTIKNAKRLERTPDDDLLLEPDDIIEVRRSLW